MINKKSFQTTSKGEAATLYTITNQAGMEIAVCDYGAVLVQVIVPDKEGNPCDVVLGYEDVKGYEADNLFLGAAIGRSANRIGKASFVLNGKEYSLFPNDGDNNLHSGMDFYSKRMWAVSRETDDSITFMLQSADGDQGYPGNLDMEVTYTLTEDNTVQMEYQGVPDADTIINMTNHSYFNLDGHASGSVLDQEVEIDAKYYTEADAQSIPTGALTEVAGTPMDFRTAKPLGRDIEQDYQALIFGQGYDHNWVLNHPGTFRRVAKMCSANSGICMEVYTDLPGMQLYTGNFITETRGKNKAVYRRRQAACFETQIHPDAIHQPQFPSPICKAGETYHTRTAYHFETL